MPVANADVQQVSSHDYAREVRMDPFLLEVARKLDDYQRRDEIMHIMDELEYMFDALEGEEQDTCSQFLSVLEKRLAQAG